MIDPFVSVHMIVRENTRLGEQFLNACFNSLYDGYYPNEIVLIDDGSSDFIHDCVYNPWKKIFKDDLDCELKVIKHERNNEGFNLLRNLCIENTYKKADFMHWIDSDEVYYPEDLDKLKNYILTDTKQIRQVWTFFFHFMINPFMIQDKCSKDNIFAFHPGLRWKHKTHEKLSNLKEGTVIGNTESRVEYLHYGYVRQQWRTCLKWLHYDQIQHGHLNGYKLENIEENGKVIQKDWFRDWRDPNHILHDRRKLCALYPNGTDRITINYLEGTKPLRPVSYRAKPHLPDAAVDLLNGCKNEQQWLDYLDKLDGYDFWDQWQVKKEEVGSWKDSLDWVVEEMEKIDWRIV